MAKDVLILDTEDESRKDLVDYLADKGPGDDVEIRVKGKLVSQMGGKEVEINVTWAEMIEAPTEIPVEEEGPAAAGMGETMPPAMRGMMGK